jgi:NAD(P)-dependent dehydrogenase (short-subunit alcohol dehydrogenase family)
VGQRFSGKVAVVIGGTSGVALACARAFVEEAAAVLLVGQDSAGAQAALRLLASGPGCAAFFQADVRDSHALERALAEAEGRYGGLDILVHVAGATTPGRVEELTEVAWDQCLDVNLKSAFLACRAALPRLRRRGGGVIVSSASNAGLLAQANDPANCAAMAGLIMLTRSLALAHAADRIRVNAVCSGLMAGVNAQPERQAGRNRPPQTMPDLVGAAPLAVSVGRLITPDEVAAAVAFLCTEEAQFVTGAILAVDGGKSAGVLQ